MNTSKPWWKSRVLWLNALSAGMIALEMNVGLLQPHLPFNFYFGMCVFLPAANAVLRVVTNLPIKS